MIDEISYLYPSSDFGPRGNVVVGDVSGSLQILFWDTSLGPRPTQAELSSVSIQAATALGWANRRKQALQALRDSDVTIIRCIETVPTAVPAAWDTYRQQLRAIISAQTGDPYQPLPTAPAAPTGP